MPPRMNESMMAGPAYPAAAWPVSTKMPAPMIAPMPSVIRFNALKARFSPCSLSAASALSWAIDLVAKRGDAIRCLRLMVDKDDYRRLAVRLLPERERGSHRIGPTIHPSSRFTPQMLQSDSRAAPAELRQRK